MPVHCTDGSLRQIDFSKFDHLPVHSAATRYLIEEEIKSFVQACISPYQAEEDRILISALTHCFVELIFKLQK